MRWLRFAAFGALVPLALFALLASGIAPPRDVGTLGTLRAHLVRFQACAGGANPWLHPICSCIGRSEGRSMPVLITPVVRATQIVAPSLPFAGERFSPRLERAFPARCEGAHGRAPTPAWPERATRLGIREGWVLIEFDLSDTCAVGNARVIDATPSGVFEATALRAIEHWRLRPAIAGGRPAARTSLRVKVVFETGAES